MSEAPIISSAQRHMLRRALGLETRSVSYRNWYVLPSPSDEEFAWRGLVLKGLALPSKTDVGVGRVAFKATHAGARAVLEPGEVLDPEDFPEEAAS